MPSTLPILRARRERRLTRQRASESRKRNSLLSVGIIVSLLVAACIATSAFSYANLTNDLPEKSNKTGGLMEFLSDLLE